MGADAGEWQVAGQNRRRHARRGRSSAQQRPKPYTGRPEVSRSSNRDETSHGYSYKQSNCRVNDGHDHQEVEASRERVWEEVQKLKHLMVLLKRSLLWETLVRHLETVLSTLNLRFPPPLPPRTYPRHQRPCDTSTTCPTTSRRPDSDYCVETADTNVSSSSFHQSMVDRGNERSAASEVGTVDGTEAGGNRVLGRNGHDQLLRELVCYGIGNFTNSHNSRYQLALALCLRDLLFPADASTIYTAAAAHGEHATAATKYESVGCKAADTCAEEPAREEVKSGAPKMQSRTTTTDEASSSSTTENMTGISWDASATEETTGASISHEDRGDGHDHFSMLVFDPVIGKLEITVLEKLGCGVIKENEQGKRCCYIPPKEAGQSEDATLGPWDVGEADEQALWRPTLFFMPHCPMRLYSNLLWANWSSQALGSIIVLGNSLAAYMDRLMPADALQDQSNAITQARGLLEELRLHPYPSTDKGRWKKDAERLPHLEFAFNDLSLSYSGARVRESEMGRKALISRPREFLEEWDGELITGRAGGRTRLGSD